MYVGNVLLYECASSQLEISYILGYGKMTNVRIWSAEKCNFSNLQILPIFFIGIVNAKVSKI
jgi:hypothetical protein